MKTTVLCVTAFVCGASVAGNLPFDMPRLVAPTFPARDFRIDAYGAKPDGAKCTAAIARALAACSEAGGGRVTVPTGTWLTGAVHLKSNCELHLEDGAELVFTDNPTDYLPAVPTSWEGVECLNYSPLVYAFNVTNVAITGRGLLASRIATWKAWHRRRADTHRKVRENLYHWCATNAPLAARNLVAVEGANARSHLIQVYGAKNVLLDGFRIRDSPFWTIHLYRSENCIVRNLETFAHGPNNDGVDIEMTRNVLVENCTFDQGDDGIVLKAGRNRDGWRLARPTENVVVSNCTFRSAHTLLGIGTELSGGIRNVYMKDCRIGKANSLCYVKTNRRRGGFVENVWLEDLEAEDLREAVFRLRTDTLYQWAEFPDYELRMTRLGGFHLNRIRGGCAGWLCDVEGDSLCPVRGLRLADVRLESVREGMAKIVHTRDVILADVRLGTSEPKVWKEPY